MVLSGDATRRRGRPHPLSRPRPTPPTPSTPPAGAADPVSRCSGALTGAESAHGATSMSVGKLHAYTAAAQAELKRWPEALESAARAAETLAAAAGERSKHVQNALVTLNRAFEALTGAQLKPGDSALAIVRHARNWKAFAPTPTPAIDATPSPTAA